MLDSRQSGSRLSAVAVADLAGVSRQTAHAWYHEGLPNKPTVPQLVRFLAKRPGYKPGSERERLAKEQADKFALDNAVKRGEVIFASQVAEVLSTLGADLAHRHDAVPGRVASEFAGTNDPAVIRERLLDELRSVRACFADAVGKLADALGTAPDDGGDSEAAAEADGEPVGRRKPRAATRKRRARKVAKR